jgi:hypothetical protein
LDLLELKISLSEDFLRQEGDDFRYQSHHLVGALEHEWIMTFHSVGKFHGIENHPN